MRLIDKIRSGNISLLPTTGDDSCPSYRANTTFRYLIPSIKTSTCVVADGLIEFLDQYIDDVHNKFGDDGFRCVFSDLMYPPFENLWVESVWGSESRHIGIFFHRNRNLEETIKKKNVFNSQVDSLFLADLFTTGESGEAVYRGACEQMVFGKNKRLLNECLLEKYGTPNYCISFGLSVVAMMNCKNISTLQDDSYSPSEKWLRRMKIPKAEYRVLRLDPFKTQVRTDSQEFATEAMRAKHICRGHFATYTDEKPLFGKYVGTFWIPAHVRGDAKNGVIVKDYRVKV